MSQIPVIKLRFFISRDSSEALIARLHEEGCVEITEGAVDPSLSIGTPTVFDHRHASARLENAVEFLSTFYKEADPLRVVFEGGRVLTSPSALQALRRSHDTERILKRVHQLKTRSVELSAERKALDEEERMILSWERLNFPLSSITDSTHTLVFPLHGSKHELNLLEEALEKESEVHRERVSDSALLIIVHRDARGAVDARFKESEVEVLRLPKTTETPAEALGRIRCAREENESEKVTREGEAATLARDELHALKQLADSARWVSEEKDTALSLSRSASVAVFDGWVPEPTWRWFQSQLMERFPALAVETLTPDDDEIPPTVIQNRGVVKPFEFITRLYGVPSHKDLDPTPFLSAFFFVFFGLSLSDFGYGVTLMLLSGAALLRYQVQSGMKSLLTMLFFGGFGAAVVGIVYGGYFGVPADTISPLLASFQAFNPIKDPMPVFYLALTFGVIQIMFGITLDIVRTAKNHDLVNGLLDNVPWLLMFLIVIAFALATSGVLSTGLSSSILALWGWFAIAAAALISITKGRLGKGIFDKLLKGILALYGGVNYFSDILSYSRLLALGLATSALGFSVNLIAGIIGGESLGIGTVFALVILIAGHVLNITISSLGAFIHSSRLQYVEFFGKFLTGTGKPFMPFARESKHTTLLPDTPG